ncbi:MAG: TetR/AcrR family transcriptional regulator [Planctomycetota bacterium]
MSKGDDTRAAILTAGMEVAASEGLEALSIGRLADRVGMSKSGLFAHFRSKEALQLAVLEHGRRAFAESVAGPALGEPRGEPRLRALLDGWLAWNWSEDARGGCLFLQAAAEYDDREGEVRDALVRIQRDLLDFLVRASELCVEEGHFRPDVDPRQFAFELFALVMAHHFYTRLLEDPAAPQRTREGLERLLSSAH